MHAFISSGYIALCPRVYGFACGFAFLYYYCWFCHSCYGHCCKLGILIIVITSHHIKKRKNEMKRNEGKRREKMNTTYYTLRRYCTLHTIISRPISSHTETTCSFCLFLPFCFLDSIFGVRVW